MPLDTAQGYPSGNDLFYECLRCGGYEVAIQWPALYDHVIPFDPQQGYPAGDALFYECLNCGTIIPSRPTDSTTCRCGNISLDVDYGRLSIKEHAVARLLAVD